MNQEDERYYSLVKMARVMVSCIQNEVDKRTVINCLMNGIFKLPSRKTGLISQEALKLPRTQRTPEHFYGRTESAERLIKELIENPNRSDKAIVAFLKSRSRTHYVTKDENMALRSYNKKNPDAHWREAYNECCSELVKYEKVSNQKYIYFIDGVMYNVTQDILSKYNISHVTLRQRCNAKKKWPNWTYILRKDINDTNNRRP